MTQKPLRKPIIGVMGPGAPKNTGLPEHARKLGKAIAGKEWHLLTGGRAAGVMDAASRGAFEAGGTTIGILPGSDLNGASEFIRIPIITGMGSARNVVNVLSSDVVVICGMGPGTASEAALAVKTGKPLFLTFVDPEDCRFLNRLSGKNIPCIEEIETMISEIDKILSLKSH